ncbi:MAG: LysE family translocator [Granulosicoccus sp.]|nr:LysE family translocator [Granulosicoccus sp.]
MSFEIWTTFVAVVTVFAIIPGPTVILVVGQAITHGRKSVTPLIAGVLIGDFVAMSLSLLGLGAILAASATLFEILKWLGVVYLIYLGTKTWFEEPEMSPHQPNQGTPSKIRLFRSSFLVTAFNPKDIIFFVAFFPQFIAPGSNIFPQIVLLMLTFLCVISFTITTYALFAGTLSNKVQSIHARKQLNRVGGSALIGAGVVTAAMTQR